MLESFYFQIWISAIKLDISGYLLRHRNTYGERD